MICQEQRQHSTTCPIKYKYCVWGKTHLGLLAVATGSPETWTSCLLEPLGAHLHQLYRAGSPGPQDRGQHGDWWQLGEPNPGHRGPGVTKGASQVRPQRGLQLTSALSPSCWSLLLAGALGWNGCGQQGRGSSQGLPCRTGSHMSVVACKTLQPIGQLVGQQVPMAAHTATAEKTTVAPGSRDGVALWPMPRLNMEATSRGRKEACPTWVGQGGDL